MPNTNLERVEPKTLERFRELFQGRTDWYGCRDFKTNAQWVEGARGPDGKFVKDEAGSNLPPLPLTDEHFHEHFNKVRGLGIIPIQTSGNVNFAAIDIDQTGIDHIALVKKIKNLGLPLYVFVSRSGDAHAFLFIGGQGKPAGPVMKRMTDWSVALGYAGHEIFPKQKDLEQQGSVGNFINLPFFNTFAKDVDPNDHKGKFVTSDGRFVGIQEFIATVQQWDEKTSLPIALRTVGFEQGPPCLETLQQQGIPPGHRNLGLYNVGVYFKKADPDNWKDLLQAYNLKYLPQPLSAKELDTISKSVARKDYQYKCKDDPIKSVCEAELCKTRLYGIKTEAERLKDKAARIDIPIEGLIKYTTDPVTWGMKIANKIINVSSGELLCYTQLRKYLMDTMMVVPPNLKADIWEVKLKTLVETAEIVEVSEDSGELQLINDMIADFVNNGSANERMLDSQCAFLKWNEIEKGSVAYITTKSIREYLMGMKINTIPVSRLTLLLKQNGWESHIGRFAGTVKRAWWKFYPGLQPKFTDEPTGETIDEALSRTTVEHVYDEGRGLSE